MRAMAVLVVTVPIGERYGIDDIEVRIVEVDPGVDDGDIDVDRICGRGARVKIGLNSVDARR